VIQFAGNGSTLHIATRIRRLNLGMGHDRTHSQNHHGTADQRHRSDQFETDGLPTSLPEPQVTHVLEYNQEEKTGSGCEVMRAEEVFHA
jgi:hypothetical protein